MMDRLMGFRQGILAQGEWGEVDKWTARNGDRVIGDPSVTEFLSKLLRADDVETVWALTCAHMKALGFGGVIYGYSPTSTGERVGEPEELLVLSTLDRRAMHAFIHKALFWQSMTFNWALRNTGIASWSMNAREAGMNEDFSATEEAKAFFEKVGMKAGCTIGFPKLRRRGRAVMGLLGQSGDDQQDVDERCTMLGDDLFVAATYAHRSMAELPFAASNRRLTARQREVLEWVAEGKSVAEIGCILSISNATVEKHLRLARETLGADSTAHAVIKAAFMNQLFIGELRP